MTRALAVATLGVLALATAACGPGSSADDGETVKVGVLAPLTGATAAEGEDMLAGAELAIDEINANGGVDGRKLQLVKGDTQNLRPDAVTSAVRRLVNEEKVDAMMTGYASGTNFEINLLRDAGIPYLLSSNSAQTADIVKKDPDAYANVWSINPTYEPYETDLPRFINNLVEEGTFKPRTKTAYIVTSDNPYSFTISEGLKRSFVDAGWRIVGYDKVPFGPVNDWRSILGKVRSKNPDVVINTDYQPPNGAAFLKQFRENPTDALVFIQYGPSVPEFLNLTKEDADGVLYNLLGGAIETTERTAAISKKFKDKFDRDPGPYGFTLYEQVRLYADTLDEVGDPSDHEAIGEAIGKTRREIAEGQLRFDPQTHLAVQGDDGLPLQWFQIRDGKRILLSPEQYADGEFELPPWFN